MTIKTKPHNTRNYYLARLVGAGKEIVFRADDMLGEIDGVRSIEVSFTLAPQELVEISVRKNYISEYKQSEGGFVI